MGALGKNKSFKMDVISKFGTPILLPKREPMEKN